jgi:hypothetical protein
MELPGWPDGVIRRHPRAQAEGVVAWGLVRGKAIRLGTLHLAFFFQLSSRLVLAAGVMAHPDSARVTQQARNATMTPSSPAASMTW